MLNNSIEYEWSFLIQFLALLMAKSPNTIVSIIVLPSWPFYRYCICFLSICCWSVHHPSVLLFGGLLLWYI